MVLSLPGVEAVPPPPVPATPPVPIVIGTEGAGLIVIPLAE